MDLETEPKGKCSRGKVAENLKANGKQDKAHENMTLKKPGWFTKNEGNKDGFIARCC